MSDEVSGEVLGSLGIITLNRPKALNALNMNMVARLLDIYQRWDPPTSPVACIVLQGAGGRALCAGGDVKSVVVSGIAGDPQPGIDFFRTEYLTDYALSQLQKPHVAILDGITMGGGAGVSINGAFRVATENTLFAMPECGIGLFPDVGASHFLQKLPGALGLYLALTGARLKGLAVKEAGLATHYIPTALLAGVLQQLQEVRPGAT
jgi:enoyl-CoA hydratase/carnithine racemase